MEVMYRSKAWGSPESLGSGMVTTRKFKLARSRTTEFEVGCDSFFLSIKGLKNLRTALRPRDHSSSSVAALAGWLLPDGKARAGSELDPLRRPTTGYNTASAASNGMYKTEVRLRSLISPSISPNSAAVERIRIRFAECVLSANRFDRFQAAYHQPEFRRPWHPQAHPALTCSLQPLRTDNGQLCPLRHKKRLFDRRGLIRMTMTGGYPADS